MEQHDYNTCVNNWADALFRFACKCTGNEEDARDVVQNSFEVLWQKKDNVAIDKGKAFLFQVAYNQSVDIHRKQKRVSYPEEMKEQSIYEHNEPSDLKKVLDRALNTLDEQSRALVILKDYEGYKYDEIAQITDLTASQVRVYLHRARKKLKDYLVSVEHVI